MPADKQKKNVQETQSDNEDGREREGREERGGNEDKGKNEGEGEEDDEDDDEEEDNQGEKPNRVLRLIEQPGRTVCDEIKKCQAETNLAINALEQLRKSSISVEHLEEEEQEKIETIAKLSSSLLELKKKQSILHEENANKLKTKCELLKKKRIEEYRQKTVELDAKERELRRKTNRLVDDLVETCGNTEFHKALIKILRDFKGLSLII